MGETLQAWRLHCFLHHIDDLAHVVGEDAIEALESRQKHSRQFGEHDIVRETVLNGTCRCHDPRSLKRIIEVAQWITDDAYIASRSQWNSDDLGSPEIIHSHMIGVVGIDRSKGGVSKGVAWYKFLESRYRSVGRMGPEKDVISFRILSHFDIGEMIFGNEGHALDIGDSKNLGSSALDIAPENAEVVEGDKFRFFEQVGLALPFSGHSPNHTEGV